MILQKLEKLKRYLLLLLVLFSLQVSAQTSLGGVVNDYFTVSTVGVNSVTCTGEDLSSLQVGDKVMLYQVKGATIYTSGSFPTANGQTDNYNNSGSFEFLAVLAVNNITKLVTFTADIKRAYDPAQKVQLIKMVEDEIVTINSEVTAANWDSASGKGGVVAIIALKKLILNANIDVSGKGFAGAQPEPYSISCRPNYASDTFYFHSSLTNRAGLKGEGIMDATFNYTKGPGHNWNGGGGGLGYLAGGGGGSLYTAGGLGDIEDTCGTVISAFGGTILGNPYFTREGTTVDPDELWPAVTFGGGGGGSTDDGIAVSSGGGNGGGIVIILTDSLISNGYSINSNGEDVTDLATGGAGGGGAGGVIIIDAEGITGTLGVTATGGDGGSVSDLLHCGGSGGGGAGGIYWHNRSTQPSNVVETLDDGLYGAGGICDHSSSQGVDGVVLSDYLAYLNGFNFNAVTGIDTVCMNQVPNLLKGSTPKGVVSPTYQWLQSNDNVNWSVISDSVRKDFQPPALSLSTYYTRIVTNDDGYSDTAYSVYIQVWPDISNNILTLTDTICSGVVPGLLSASTPSGGDGSGYDYIWESTESMVAPVWTNKGSDLELDETVSLTQTTYYRRIVISAKVCFDTTLVDSLTVLPSILLNNITSPDTTICSGLEGGVIQSTSPTGGDGTYRYEWILSANGTDYSAIGGANNSTYNKGVLTTPSYYQRIVYSGNDDACEDTSIVHFIDVLPQLENFEVVSDSMKYCYEDSPLELRTNPLLTGGDAPNYTYQWLVLNVADWEILDGETNSSYFPPNLIETTSYKRAILSGADDACKDTSDAFEIQIIPDILDNILVSEPADICEGGTPDPFVENLATGGEGGITYQWQIKVGDNAFVNAGGTSTEVSYNSGPLADVSFFRRQAISDICIDISDTIEVVVFPAISGNSISGGNGCYNSENELVGTDLLGGIGTYSYNWLISPDGLSWTVIPESDSIHYTTEKITDETYFSRIAFSGVNNECVDTSDAMLLILNSLPTGTLVDKSDTLCQSEPFTLEYSSLTGVSDWIIEVGEPGNVLRRTVLSDSDAGGGELTFELDASVEIRILSLEDGNGCLADTSIDNTRVNAFVYTLPEAEAGIFQEVCGDQAIMSAQLSVENSYGTWYLDNGSVEPEGSPTGTMTAGGYGEYNIIWRESTSSDCYSEDEITITFWEQPTEINAGVDIEDDYTFVHQLEADPTFIGTGYWTKSSGEGEVTFDDSTLYNAIATLSGEGTYSLLWSIENGVCDIISDELLITNNPQVIYQGFSPNNDNINDDYIAKLQEGSDGELIIYDVNGVEVWRLEPVNSVITWDGKRDGVDLPEGTYYFILKEDLQDGSEKINSGFIELRR